MIKSTRRGLLISFFWYIRPVEQMTLLNTGMTRDGMFLIENGEIVGPVQNFRWNDGPARGFNNITMLGAPVPMHIGEAYDNPGTALVPRDEDRGLPDDVDLACGVRRLPLFSSSAVASGSWFASENAGSFRRAPTNGHPCQPLS